MNGLLSRRASLFPIYLLLCYQPSSSFLPIFCLLSWGFFEPTSLWFHAKFARITEKTLIAARKPFVRRLIVKASWKFVVPGILATSKTYFLTWNVFLQTFIKFVKLYHFINFLKDLHLTNYLHSQLCHIKILPFNHELTEIYYHVFLLIFILNIQQLKVQSLRVAQSRKIQEV